MGDLLLSRLLDLNKVQSGIMTLLFKVAEDNSDKFQMKYLASVKLLLKYLADNAFEFKREYGNITYSSIGAIQREILGLQKQGVDQFFNTPVFDVEHLFQVNDKNQGVINILQADTLIKSPKLYITFLLWLLSELYERLPEVGDLDKPKFVFFFDEAHLLFTDCPKILLNKIEQTIRLIRSKGVGIYFVSQSAMDIPDTVLRQLGNRVQHALRAFTPRDRKAVKAIGETFRDNPKFKTAKAITELKTGEALISFLGEDGDPNIVEIGKVILPESELKPLDDSDIREIVMHSNLYGIYEREGTRPEETVIRIGENNNRGVSRMAEDLGRGMVRSMGNRLGNQVMRGIFNTFQRGVRGGLGK